MPDNRTEDPHRIAAASLPDAVRIVVEVPRGGFVKRRIDATVDYVSPLPSPFNYGCVPDTPAPDGDPLDVVLLGPRRPVGWSEVVAVWGVVRFVDDGATDDKLVCGTVPPTPAQRALVRAFFTAYARAKGLLNRARGRTGPTRLVAVVWGDGYDRVAPPSGAP